MSVPAGRTDVRRAWGLDPEVRFLNHGSYGACPSAVLAHQCELRDRLEREPVAFFSRELEPRLDEAREELARFAGADPEGLAFVPNATTGVNTVLASLAFGPGDEFLATNHGYNACRNALEETARRTGAQVVVADVPLPLAGAREVTDAVLERVTSRTRLVLIDHVTSPTGIVFPVREIVRELDERGIDTLVDGAHAPGMVPLDLGDLDAAYYTGNAHKWLCAPKGAGFLVVREDRRGSVRPLVISHGMNSSREDRSRFRLLFDWTGTHDPTPFLCVPEAIRFLASLLPGGWGEVRERNRDLALRGRRILAGALRAELPCPDSMIGSLAAVPLPPASEAISREATDPLQARLFDEERIEVPVIHWPESPARWVRVSAQLYNGRSDYERLAEALVRLLSSSEPS